jgi:hypothetical protein
LPTGLLITKKSFLTRPSALPKLFFSIISPSKPVVFHAAVETTKVKKPFIEFSII